MAEIQVTREGAVLTCLGLGSCIGLLAFDPEEGIAGMAHIMLPQAFKDKPIDKLGKFADTCVPELISQMEAHGALRQRMLFAYVGGAQVFKGGAAANPRLDVGGRNTTAVAGQLLGMNARIVAQDVGGCSGRTVIFDPTTGVVKVRTVQGGERTLCVLKAVQN